MFDFTLFLTHFTNLSENLPSQASDYLAPDVLFGLFYLALVSYILFRVSLEDIRSRTIPNRYPLFLLLCGIVHLVAFPSAGPEIFERVAGFFVISMSMLLLSIFWNGAFGGGDIKLMAAAGFCLGLHQVWNATVIGIFSAAVWSVSLLLIKKIRIKDRIAFGPFLCLGIALEEILLFLANGMG